MNEEHSSIHDFEFDLICEYYTAIDRQGPGSPDVTIKALSFIDSLHSESRIADLGCGTGGQTMVLAQNTPGIITGLDLFPAFIDLFNENAQELGIDHRVKGVVGSMDNLPFDKESLDLIWSEGAIYNLGFERGLNEWYPFIKKGGYIAVSEATWFTNERPTEIHDFWVDAYPYIDTIPNKVRQLQAAGFIPVANFILPENCWFDHFYAPQKKAQEDFLEKYKGNQTAEAFIENERREAQLYRKYKDFYGYVFYIGKKI